MCKVAISQSNYIPWKGYFDLIASVDKFILYDDMQFTKRDWRNRNKIKTSQGIQWLTIPVQVKGKFSQKINETKILPGSWAKKHLKSFEINYKKSGGFVKAYSWLEKLFADAEKLEMLSEVNFLFIKAVCKKLGIETELIDSRQFTIEGTKSEALLSILKQIDGVTSYVSGPAAKVYLKETIFNNENLKLHWFDYNGYPEYVQLHPPFVHDVSILDLMFNEGDNANKYLKSFSF